MTVQIKTETIASCHRWPLGTSSPADVARAVRARARDGLEIALTDLRDWVGHDTPSDDPGLLDALARAIAERVAGYGAEVELIGGEGGHSLHAAVTGSGRGRIALLCHHDTVFPAGTAAGRPFSVDGEVARGPGGCRHEGRAGRGRRTRCGCSRATATATAASSSCRCPTRSFATARFHASTGWRGFDAVLCMECGRPGNGVVTARKGGQWVSITVEGRSAHAGVAADRGHSALLAVCREALRIAELDDAREGLSVNATLLSAGEVLNSVPSSAALRLDVRAWRAADLDWAIAEVGRFGDYPGVRFRIDPGDAGAGVRAFARHRAAVRALRSRPAGRSARRWSRSPPAGVSDASWTAAPGIPTLDGLGPIGEDDHSPAERIVVSSIPDRIALVSPA